MSYELPAKPEEVRIMLEIKDSVAVITGGAGGIGSVLAKHWLEGITP